MPNKSGGMPDYVEDPQTTRNKQCPNDRFGEGQPFPKQLAIVSEGEGSFALATE
jgi:hypothetical protein